MNNILGNKFFFATGIICNIFALAGFALVFYLLFTSSPLTDAQIKYVTADAPFFIGALALVGIPSLIFGWPQKKETK